MTEILLPRIARQEAAYLSSIRGSARTTRIDRFELDEGLQPCHPPFRCVVLFKKQRNHCGLLNKNINMTTCTISHYDSSSSNSDINNIHSTNVDSHDNDNTK